MPLLTQISNLFSKKQSQSLVGLSLQQEFIHCCSIPTLNQGETTDINAETKVNCQKLTVNQLDFSAAINHVKAVEGFSGQCHIVLAGQLSQIVQVDKPVVPSAEINSALKWQIKDLVTIAPENMVLDYFDGPVLAGGKEKINVVCSPLNELQKIVAAANQSDMAVVSITTAEFAFAHLLPWQHEACLLVCQQPNEEVVLLIVKQGELYFHRRLRGFSQLADKTEDELATTIIDTLALEIQRSSDYFERQLKQAPIKEIKVLLPIAAESFIARKLTETSHVPVTLLTLPEAYQEHREYAAAIGATMADVRANERDQERINVS